MKIPPVSIIVANFNGEKYLSTCLNSIFDSLYPNFEVIIVDDGSSDRSVEIIKKFQKVDKRIVLLLNKKNIGAAARRNVALKKVKGDVIIFLDNDTEVTKNWITELIKPLLREKSVGAVQALLLDFNKRDQIQMAGGLLIPHTGWLAPFYHGESYKKVKNILSEREIVSISAALAVKKEVIDTIGGFDEEEARYTEDLDFCWRIWIAGYKIVLAPNAIVYHWTKSVKQRASAKASYKQIYFHLAKNSIRSIFKNYEFTNVLKYLPISILINIGRGLLFLFSQRRVDALVGSLEAIIWLFYNSSDTLKARGIVQASRKFGDKYLMRKIFTQESLIQVYNKHFR